MAKRTVSSTDPVLLAKAQAASIGLEGIKEEWWRLHGPDDLDAFLIIFRYVERGGWRVMNPPAIREEAEHLAAMSERNQKPMLNIRVGDRDLSHDIREIRVVRLYEPHYAVWPKPEKLERPERPEKPGK